MNKKISIIIAALTLPALARATNGYQLIGVGAYQKGLAGAVTANPGSAMTAVSNPAGAARVGSRADFSMEAFMPERDVDFTALAGNKGKSAVSLYGVPSLGWTAPTSKGSNMYFGGGMYGTSGMGVDYASTKMTGGAPNRYWDGYSNIAFWQMAPVLAWNVDDKLSLGISLNIDYQSVAFQQRVLSDTTGNGVGDTVVDNFDLSRAASSFGFGLGLGILYDLNPQITLGFSYKSKQRFSDMEYQLAYGDIYSDTQTAGSAGTYKLALDFPQQAAAGIAYRPNSKLTLSADLKWINWSDTMNKLAVTGPNNFVRTMNPGWDDQTVFAVGVNYDLNDRISLRGGYNYAKSPFGENQASRNLILPAIVESHYTLGAGFVLNSNWDLSVHYMYTPKKTLQAPATDLQAPGAIISLQETSFGANIGYRF